MSRTHRSTMVSTTTSNIEQKTGSGCTEAFVSIRLGQTQIFSRLIRGWTGNLRLSAPAASIPNINTSHPRSAKSLDECSIGGYAAGSVNWTYNMRRDITMNASTDGLVVVHTYAKERTSDKS